MPEVWLQNWLRTMLGEREDLFAPHPPHIMRDCLPILPKFGNIGEDVDNLKMLIDHVCTFVENNQVQWQDKHGRPIKFDKKTICKRVIISVQCMRSVKMVEDLATLSKDGIKNPDPMSFISKAKTIIGREYYLLAIFDEIMHAGALANGKSIWACKSMGMSQFHDMLLNLYGRERLRYIYLVRDPRDVCLSFMKTPVGDCHPYAISQKWARLQRHATRIMSEEPDLIHRVSYENILRNQDGELDKIDKFMGARALCKTMRRGSVAQLKEVSQLCTNAKGGIESLKAAGLSVQFRNLTRGDSFKKEQFQKWASGAMRDEDILIVESSCLEEMTSLGYEAHLVGKSKERIDFTDELTSQYTRENKASVDKMMRDLLNENPEDFERRKVQKSILEAPATFFSVSFSKMDIDPYMSEDEDSEPLVAVSEDNLLQWPRRASDVGYLSGEDVSKRFDLQDTKTIRLGKKKERGTMTLTYAAATQRGYYPSDTSKTKTENQDAFLAGPCIPNNLEKDENNRRALFAVFDGHGVDGDKCAALTRDEVQREMNNLNMNIRKGEKKVIMQKEAATSNNVTTSYKHKVQQALCNAYGKANNALLESSTTFDVSESGTTAVSLVIESDGSCHIANTGDSRCLIVSNTNGCNHISISTTEHTLDDIDESSRIEKHGGLVMTSEQYDVMDNGITSFETKRVWSKDGKFPGCAFSRSIGDTKAKSLGVIAEPDIIEHNISRSRSEGDTLFILGSDGIFDFISDEDVMSIASKYDNPSDACKVLVGLAYQRWIYEEDRADDITVIIGRISHTHAKGRFGLRFPRCKCTA